MGLIDFILNLAGLLLWLNWRAAKADPLGRPAPATLIGTLRRAEPVNARRWHLPAALGCLLLLRALFYLKIGSVLKPVWAGTLDFGVIAPSFVSSSFWRILAFSIFSFARMFGIVYLWLVLLSILSGPMPTHRLVKMQLGKIDGWPRWIKCLLPLAVIALLWWLASWPLAWLEIIPKPVSVAHRIGESLVIALGSYLVWKFLIAALLVLHLLNSYIYFGRHPFWNYVNATAKQLLRPLEKIPLRVDKADFAPVVGIALVFLLAYCVRNGIKLFHHVGEIGSPLTPLINIPGLADIYSWLSL
ncbi:MAG: hypothetical protein ABSE90_08355 [Verrucomicrobiota bacterium]